MIKNITKAAVMVAMMGAVQIASAENSDAMQARVPVAPQFAAMQAHQAEMVKYHEAQRAQMQQRADAFHQQMEAQMKTQMQSMPVANAPAFPEMPKDMQEQQAEMDAYHAKIQQEMQSRMTEAPKMPAMPEMPAPSFSAPEFPKMDSFADREKFHQQRLEERQQRRAKMDEQIKARRAEFEKMKKEHQAARTQNCAA